MRMLESNASIRLARALVIARTSAETDSPVHQRQGLVVGLPQFRIVQPVCFLRPDFGHDPAAARYAERFARLDARNCLRDVGFEFPDRQDTHAPAPCCSRRHTVSTLAFLQAFGPTGKPSCRA